MGESRLYFGIDPPQDDNPTHEWLMIVDPLLSNMLFAAQYGEDGEIGEREFTLALVMQKDVNKRLAKLGEKPLFDLLERRSSWARFDRAERTGNALETKRYEVSPRLREALRSVFTQGVTDRHSILIKVWDIARHADPGAIDAALHEVGVRPATLDDALRQLVK